MVETWRDDETSKNWGINFQFYENLAKDEAHAQIQKLLDEKGGKIPKSWISSKGDLVYLERG